MVLFTKYKAIGAVALTFALAAVPVMAEHKPDAFISGLREWLWLIYPIMGLLSLYAVATLGFYLGQRDQSPHAPAALGTEPPLDPQGRTLDDLVYAARTITNALLEDGELRYGAITEQIPKLERQHRAWHDNMRHQARDDFLVAVRRTLQARQLNLSWMAGPGPHYGELPAEQREGLCVELKQRRDNLVLVLQALKLVEASVGGGGPELIEAE